LSRPTYSVNKQDEKIKQKFCTLFIERDVESAESLAENLQIGNSKNLMD